MEDSIELQFRLIILKPLAISSGLLDSRSFEISESPKDSVLLKSFKLDPTCFTVSFVSIAHHWTYFSPHFPPNSLLQLSHFPPSHCVNFTPSPLSLRSPVRYAQPFNRAIFNKHFQTFSIYQHPITCSDTFLKHFRNDLPFKWAYYWNHFAEMTGSPRKLLISKL